MTGLGTPKLILVIVADQLRADHVGFGGMEIAHTPCLDALATKGTVFDRVHVTNPTCMPSRASLATGRWPSVHGTRTNGVPLDPTAETLMKSLRGAGWFTAAVGKLHLQTMGWAAEDLQLAEIAATNPSTTDFTIPDARASWGDFPNDCEDISRHRSQRVEMPEDYYGFVSVDLVSGHGDRASGQYWHWVRDQGTDPELLGGYDNSARRSTTWNQLWESGVPGELSTSSYVAQHTIAQIEAAAQRDEPTFVFASFPDPHHPFCPPAPYTNLIRHGDIELPATFNQSADGLPPHIQHMLANRGTPDPDPTMSFAVTEQQYREALVNEIGLMAMLDDSVGQILDAVDQVGLSDQSAVLFTSDHGDLFGDHGLMLKHHIHYEGVTRVPLLIAGPGVPVKRSDALVSNADIVPTILDLADAPGFRGIQGKSLAPVLAGKATVHRDGVLVEEDLGFGTTGLSGPVRMRTLITDEGRLTLYHGEDFGECYALAEDPGEERNQYDKDKPTPLELGLRDHLLHEVLSLADDGAAMLHGA